MIPESFIQELLNRVDIVDVVDKSVPLKKAGANYSACCPFHNEKSPSFTVSPTKQFYHCFGCGAHGTAIGFLMEYQGVSFVEAVQDLAKNVGLVVPQEARDVDKPAQKVVVGLQESLQQAANYYKAELKKSQRAIDYLKNRGLSGQIAAKFQIGYAPAGWQNLQSVFPHYESEALTTAGLVVENDQRRRYDRFRDRIMFPIHDQKGQVIGFGGRVINPEDTPKYCNSPETPVFQKGHELYGLFIARRAIRDAGRALVVEGYMDVIKMHTYGYNNTVAALGTSLTDNQIKLMKRYSKDYYIAFDSDNAGQKASLKAINMIKRNNLEAKVVIMPNAKDPDEYLNKYGKINFDKLIQNSLDYYSFLEFHFKEIFENSNKVEYINNFFDNIVNVTSEIEKELIFEKLSRKAGVSKESIIKEYNKKSTKQGTFVKTAQPVKVSLQVNKITTSHEEKLIKLVLINNDFALQLKEIVNEDTFKDLEYYNIFKEMYEFKINEMSLDKDSLNNLIKDKMDVKVLMQYDDVDYDNLEALFKDCIKRLKIKYYEKKKNILTDSLTQSENSANSKEIMNEIFILAKKIKSTKEEVN